LPTNSLFFCGNEIDSFPDQLMVVLLPGESGGVRGALRAFEDGELGLRYRVAILVQPG
jgi:hypothetical protein